MVNPRIISYVAGGAIALALPVVAFYEGKRNAAYLDPIKKPTICYGYTSGVRIGDYKSDDDCEALLAEELEIALAAVDRCITAPLSPQERAAYASFTYNVGQGALCRSTLARKANAGDRAGACNQLSRWVYAGGKKLRGLVRRREAERELCLNGI